MTTPQSHPFHVIPLRRSGVMAGLAAAAALITASPAQAAKLTWNITFFDEAGGTVGSGQFITESKSQKILIGSDPVPYNFQDWKPKPTRNILQDFTANIEGVSWTRQDDDWGDWDRISGDGTGINDDGTGSNPPYFGYASWLDQGGDLTRRFGYPYFSVYQADSSLPTAGWVFREGGIRNISLQGLSMQGNMLKGTSSTNTWSQYFWKNVWQPGMEQVQKRGTWAATLERTESTPEPGTALGLMAIGLWAWQRRSQQTTQD
jgi:hypothetical protein